MTKCSQNPVVPFRRHLLISPFLRCCLFVAAPPPPQKKKKIIVLIHLFCITDEHIQRIQNELQPLRKRIADSELSVSESKRKLSRGQTEYVAALTPVRSAFRGEPRARDVINILQTTKNQLNQYEASQATTRPAITQQGHPPARIRQFIKGKLKRQKVPRDHDFPAIFTLAVFKARKAASPFVNNSSIFYILTRSVLLATPFLSPRLFYFMFYVK